MMPYGVAQLGHPYVCAAQHSDQILIDERIRPHAIEAAQHARHIFATFQNTRDEVIDLRRVPEQVSVVANGYDHGSFPPRRYTAMLLKEFELDILTC
jgi:hypothetical protein